MHNFCFSFWWVMSNGLDIHCADIFSKCFYVLFMELSEADSSWGSFLYARPRANPHRRLPSWCCCPILKRRSWGPGDTASWTHVTQLPAWDSSLAVCSRVWLASRFPAPWGNFLARLLSWYSTLCIVLWACYTVIWEFFSFHVPRAFNPQILAALNLCGDSCRKEPLGKGM